MLEERQRGQTGTENGYAAFQVMDALLDKLKLLQYGENFCKPRSIKPLNRHYFAIKTDTNEQLYVFANILSWLLSLVGPSFDPPEQFDDPNSIASKISKELRKHGLKELSSNKIKAAHGLEICTILNDLAQQALRSREFKWQPPVILDEDDETDEVGAVGEEVVPVLEQDEDVEEDIMDDDDDAYLEFDSTRLADQSSSTKKQEILKSNTTSAEWKLELERVLPQLKVQIRRDVKDWRNHLNQIQDNNNEIEDALSSSHAQLDQLQREISKTLEKISSREKYLNSQLENSVEKFRLQQDSLTAQTERYKQAHLSVSELSSTLNSLTEQLDDIRQQTEEKGSTVTDAAPVVKIKQSLTRLKEEIHEMDIRIGVLQHVLLSHAVSERGGMVKQMYGGQMSGRIDDVQNNA